MLPTPSSAAITKVSGAGVAVSGASTVVLGWLAVGKHCIAGRIRSQALRADSWLSATGCLLAGITVAGTGLNLALGWWWADLSAASPVAVGAIAIGAHLGRNG